MVVTAVVFDLDGTLFDHHRSAREGLEAWLLALGSPLTDDLTLAWFAAEERHFMAWRQGDITFAEQRRRRLREFLPLIDRSVGDNAELDETFVGFLNAYRRAWCGYDDVFSGLEAVHRLGLTTAVLTNGSEEQQRAKLAHLGLLESVGPVFTAEALGAAKPSPRAFHAVCEHLGLSPSQALYVGDDHAIDVLAARAAGMRAVLLDRLGVGPLDEPERITTLAELDDCIARVAGSC